jgi:transcriptional regulator with XRE-family HTH domain
MSETLTIRSISLIPAPSDSSEASRRIHKNESDAFVERLRELVGDKKVIWFANECGIGESTLRNILAGAWPRTDILIALADAGGVTLDWLATGRLPKTRAEVSVLLAAAQPTEGESELIDTYRMASGSGRNAMNKVSAAIRTQTMVAWFAAGVAMSEAANILEKNK